MEVLVVVVVVVVVVAMVVVELPGGSRSGGGVFVNGLNVFHCSNCFHSLELFKCLYS